MVFSTFRRSPLWPRQRGNVKEYNEVFDANVKRSQLQLYLPEEHLVKAYVGGLNDELRDSVESFQPRTIGGARAYAQMEEWDLQQQAKKVDEARRLAKVQELSVAQNRVSTRQLSCLRQTGTLAEFNAKFDAISATLDLTEEYLVGIYVAALKDEIANSVQMFHPSTLGDARRLARLQEVSLQWLAKKAEKVRKELENPEKACSTNTQEGPVENTATNEHQEGKVVEPLVSKQETENKNGGWTRRNLPGPTQPDSQVTALSNIVKMPLIAAGPELPTTKEQNKAATKQAKLSSRVNGSPRVNSTGGVHELSHVMDTREVTEMVPGVVCFSSFMDCSVLEDYTSVSRSVELVMVCTCMKKVKFENSEFLSQLVSIFQNEQGKSIELSPTQLISSFSGCQRYFEDACGFFMLKGQMGFDCSSKGKGPRFHSWINFKWPPCVQICPIPTLCLIQFWFRGKLIKMLAGSALHQLFYLVQNSTSAWYHLCAICSSYSRQISSNSLSKISKVFSELEAYKACVLVVSVLFFRFRFVFCSESSLRARMFFGEGVLIYKDNKQHLGT